MSDKPDIPESYKHYNLHPETVTFLNRLLDVKWTEIFSEDDPEKVRKKGDLLWRVLNPEISFEGQITDEMIPIDGVQDGIPVTVYKPTNAPENPSILVYFHGGGFVVGSRVQSEDSCKSISSESGCISINVEYRLCPETKLHAIFSDAQEIMRYIMQNKQKFGGSVDSTVGIGGDSAGGTISAQVSHDVTGIAYQILIYPWNDLSLTSKTAEEFKDDAIVPSGAIQWFRKYLGINLSTDQKDPKLSVVYRSSFTGLPPALFIVAELDPLRDDCYIYKEKLAAAGVETELHLFEGIPHIFFLHPGTFKEVCRKAYTCVSDFIRKFQ